jgi:hypothetical protein
MHDGQVLEAVYGNVGIEISKDAPRAWKWIRQPWSSPLKLGSVAVCCSGALRVPAAVIERRYKSQSETPPQILMACARVAVIGQGGRNSSSRPMRNTQSFRRMFYLAAIMRVAEEGVKSVADDEVKC